MCNQKGKKRRLEKLSVFSRLHWFNQKNSYSLQRPSAKLTLNETLMNRKWNKCGSGYCHGKKSLTKQKTKIRSKPKIKRYLPFCVLSVVTLVILAESFPFVESS